eukprot:TRINITY_DN2641_c0_g1_i7.p1 TRINITY_DN2641_c0_g1~~TRINITY_DN2641_c0_g1_i7.p1  ORF type:complete len:100 (+),score=13.93 TRINITY_DN2641_c0_g1_i7:227-526(+)
MTSSILRIILTTCVASRNCCAFDMYVSNTFCSLMSAVPTPRQSTPRRGLRSATWRARSAATAGIAAAPAFSASASGTASSASANARTAYCPVLCVDTTA